MAFLTKKMQLLLIYTLQNETISKETQPYYKSRNFYNTVSFLKKNGFIRPVCYICRSHIENNGSNICNRNDLYHKQERRRTKENIENKKTYALTLAGEMLSMVLRNLKK